MKYHDRVYGSWDIQEPIIIDLIHSPSLQRLKGIDQGGYRPFWYKDADDIGEYDHSRFAHSLGVYLLLRKYGAPLEEQIAGLLHDVSHSAFSHCIDYVLEGGSEKEQSHQDRHFAPFVKRSEIPEILHRYGFDVDYILEDRHFPLKEQDLPDLCADRIDYSLRTAVLFHEWEVHEVDALLDRLIVHDGKWVFTDFTIAQRYARLFLKLNQQYYAGISSAAMFRAVGDCLQYALQMGYISEDDLYTNDRNVLEKVQLYALKDKKLHSLWECMNNKYPITTDPESATKRVFCKSRVVDPLWLAQDVVKRVSDHDREWLHALGFERNPKEYCFSFIYPD